MVGSISTRIKRRPVLAFYVLASALTWLGWVPQALHSHGLLPFGSPFLYLLGVGPMVVAFDRGRESAGPSLFRMFRRQATDKEVHR
jgi:hypothetical protein